MKNTTIWSKCVILACTLVIAGIGWWSVGCGGSSGTDVQGNYSGAYVAYPNQSFLTPYNSGVRVTTLTITQAADNSITAVDNNGATYSGDLDGLSETEVNFWLRGGTSKAAAGGNSVYMEGILAQSNSFLTIQGTWNEGDGTSCVLSGTTERRAAPKKLEPVTLHVVDCGDGCATYAASGGSGRYVWSVQGQNASLFSNIPSMDTTQAQFCLNYKAAVPKYKISVTFVVSDAEDASNTASEELGPCFVD